jgi:hypothetical protein
MKKWFFPLMLVALFFQYAKADLGSCVVYHAKFYLKNGDIFNGCFECPGYDEAARLDSNNRNAFCHDKGIFKLFKTRAKNEGAVTVYKNLHYVKVRPMRKKQEEMAMFGFVEPSEVIYLDSARVSKIIFWHAEYSKRWWITAEIITGSKGMLDTLKNQRYWNHLLFSNEGLSPQEDSIREDPWIDGPYTGYVFYNYNAKINKAELRRLILSKVPRENIYDRFNQYWNKKGNMEKPSKPVDLQRFIEKDDSRLRKWFWQRGILIVRINGTC